MLSKSAQTEIRKAGTWSTWLIAFAVAPTLWFFKAPGWVLVAVFVLSVAPYLFVLNVVEPWMAKRRVDRDVR